MSKFFIIGIFSALGFVGMTNAQAQKNTEIKIYAAGSLRSALTEIAQYYEATNPTVKINFAFGASGLLRDRLLAGEISDIFASANMDHPEKISNAGKSESVIRFTSNKLCVLANPNFNLAGKTLVERMMDKEIKLGISTPKADPSGDYAFEMFEKIDSKGLGPKGVSDVLKTKALQLTGGPQSPQPPANKNVYGDLVATGQADIFITYCTNAEIAIKENPAQKALEIPDAYNITSNYGMVVFNNASQSARDLYKFITSPKAQEIFIDQGFAKL